jgi:membrane fusion protein, copper/silver efflux system
MRAMAVVVAVLLALGGAGAAGYWLGSNRSEPAPTPGRTALYYQDPSGAPYYAATPKKAASGRDYVPVYDDADPAPAPTARTNRKPLYYRNPMGLPDTSPAPKKDAMGMDYVPVFEDDDGGGAAVKVSIDKIQRLGVRTEPAQRRALRRTVRAVGTIKVNERKQTVVTTKFEGFVERLRVNATGETVRRGQPLLDFYAPEVVAAQQEYLLAWRALGELAGAPDDVRASAAQIAESSLQRLRNWDISDDQVARLKRSGAFARTLSLRSPADGVVMEKSVVEGMRFMPGDALYRIADLSTVWLMADVFERDLAAIREGEAARLALAAYPGEVFTGKVAFVYPTVTRDTRTAKLRIEVPNADGRLKIDMYGEAELEAAASAGPVLAVPDSAILDTGTRQAVLIDRGDGRFEPRAVKLGTAADGYREVTDGLQPGDIVVTSANFLIDAESNLRAALQSFVADKPATDGAPQ